MRTIFRNFFIVFATIISLLIIGCGGGSSDNINPVAPAAQTGTLQGTVSLPPTSLRRNIDDSASNTANIASSTSTEDDSIRASISFKGTKVWLEDFPDIFSFTDDEGHYTISNVPFGKHRVVANVKIGNNEYKWRSDIQNVIDTIVKIVPLIVMQPAKNSISGFVYDSLSKKAIQEVKVEVWGQKSSSDGDGKYTVYNMPAGSWDVTFSKDGYQTLVTTMSFAEGKETSGNFYLVPVDQNEPNIASDSTPTPILASDSSSVAITELNPAYQAKSVSIQTTISAFFNGAQVNTNYAKIDFTSGNPKNVGGTFAFINDHVIYTHNEEWPVDSKIAGTITNLKDYLGKDIASFSFEFTTTANVVKSLIPADNSTNIEVNVPIEITFNTKINRNLDFLSLIKVTDKDNKSLAIKKEQLSWSTNSEGKDVLKISDLPFEVEKQYWIKLSEKILDNNGNPLDGQKEFSFSTRGAIWLTYEPANVCHALSDVRFKINGGTITDVSKAKVSLSCNNVSGKLSVEGNYLVYKLDIGSQWPFGTNVTINLSNLTDVKNARVNDVSASFLVTNQCEITKLNNKTDLTTTLDFNTSYGNETARFDISEARIQFDNANVRGRFYIENQSIVYRLDDGQIYPVATKVKGSLSGIKDQYGIAVKDYTFEFTTRNKAKLYMTEPFNNEESWNDDPYRNYQMEVRKDYLVFATTFINEIGNGKIIFNNNSIKGSLSLNNGKLTYKLNSNTQFPYDNIIKGTVTGFKDVDGLSVSDFSFAFYAFPYEGKGTKTEPYLVSDAKQLDQIRYFNDNYYFKQTQDIDLSDFGSTYDNGKGWMPIGNPSSEQYYDYGYSNTEYYPDWTGHYDGDGHKITNLYINRPNDSVGIFGNIQGCVTKLGVEVSAITCCSGGAIASKLYKDDNDDTNISNCWVTGDKIIAQGSNNGNNGLGGLFGLVSANKICNCYSNIDLEVNNGTNCIGGFSGEIYANATENCYSLGNIQSNSSSHHLIGGFVGNSSNELYYSQMNSQYFDGVIRCCFSKGNINLSSNDTCTVGGFFGGAGGLIYNCYSTGNITASRRCNVAGGFGATQHDFGGIINSYSTGNVLASADFVGGFVGNYSAPTLKNCYAGCSKINGGKRIVPPIPESIDYSRIISNCYANKDMIVGNSTVSSSLYDGSNLPDSPNWKTQIFKDGYENGTSFDDIWEIGTSGLPILKNMPGNPEQ